MRSLHLFAGAGGGLLADLILGHQPVGAVELDPYCCSALRARRDDGWFPGLRVHEQDIRLFDPSEYAGRVDIVSGGFPCVDISAAGRGIGIKGERSGLWSEFARVIRLVRPRFAFVENSPMLARRGLDVVLSDLASLGYDAEWQVISASQVGAPHRRERIWILAYANDGTGCPQQRSQQEVRAEFANDLCQKREPPLANARGGRCDKSDQWQDQQSWRAEIIGTGEDVANTNRLRQPQPQGGECDQRGRAGDGSESRIGADWGELESDVGGLVDGLAHELVPGWWDCEPDIGRVATGVKNRVSQLKALGNGQVPLQAAAAWKILMERL